MGGRRPYSLEDVFGKSKKVRRDRRQISAAVKGAQAEPVTANAARLFVDSDRPVRLLAEAIKGFSSALSEAEKGKPKSYAERKRAANKAWAKEREKRGVQTSLVEDRIVSEALARALRRKKARR